MTKNAKFRTNSITVKKGGGGEEEGQQTQGVRDPPFHKSELSFSYPRALLFVRVMRVMGDYFKYLLLF